MFETCGKIDRAVLEDILKHKYSLFQKVVLWVILGGGIAYFLAGILSGDSFGALFGGLMAALGVYALIYRPRKWMKIQEEAFRANNTDHLTYRTSFEPDHVRVRCETNGFTGDLAYSNFTKGAETNDLIVLFTFREEYVVTFKKQLGEYQTGQLKKHLSGKLSRKFKWI